MPGPMVDESVTDRTYLPLAAAGLARCSSSMTARTLARSLSPVKLALPTGTWMLPTLSVRYSTRPPLNSRTARPTSVVTVPVLGLGMRPRGPRTRPSLPTWPMRSGVAMATSKSRKPPWTRATRSSAPTTSAPASRASLAASPAAKATTRTFLPVPAGRPTVPRTIWSALRGSTPRRTASSTVSSNLAVARLLTRSTASPGPCWRSRSKRRTASTYFFLSLFVWVICSALHREAHGAGGAPDLALGRLQVVGVEVGELGGGDLGDLGVGDRAGRLPARGRRPLVDAGRSPQENGSRRGLDDERERPVLEHRDLGGNDRAPLGLGGRVVLLAELHDVHAVGTQGGTDRRGGGGRSRRDLDLDDRGDASFGHAFPSSWWSWRRRRRLPPCLIKALRPG